MASRKRIKALAEDTEKVSKNKVEYDYPLFCFKHLNTSKSIKGKNDIGFSFIIRAQKLCELGWNEIHKSCRHSFGYEKMPITQLKVGKFPNIVTPDIRDLHIFRYTGDNKPFVCLIVDNVIHVLFVEAKFGDIYNH